MKETKTTYSYLIEHMQNPSIQKVWDYAFDFVQKLPAELCDNLHGALNRGVDILDSEPLLQMYIYSYGKMHKAKLEYAFDNLQEHVLKYDEIEIIDYGCGQGLATICYHDYIVEHNVEQHVKKITLIEPSEMALSRAELLCSKFFPETEIVAINKHFDDLTNDDLMVSNEMPTIHLLSNILDVESYDLLHLSRIVKEQSVGENEFVIVSPMQSPQRVKRLKSFASHINKDVYFEDYLDKRELQEDKDWTCVVMLCSSNNNTGNGLEFNIDDVYNEAFELIKNKDKDEARCQKVFNKIKHGADAGDKKCLNALGALYISGLHIPKNYEEAFHCFSKSAEKNFLPAIANLAVCYNKGAGTDVDHFKEVELLEKAVALKYLPCYSQLAECYIYGEGVEECIDKGIQLLKYAAEQNDKQSCFLLGECYQNGIGVERDIPMAIQYYTKAGLLEDKKAIIALVNIYEEENYKDLFGNEQFDVFVLGAKLSIKEVLNIFTLGWFPTPIQMPLLNKNYSYEKIYDSLIKTIKEHYNRDEEQIYVCELSEIHNACFIFDILSCLSLFPGKSIGFYARYRSKHELNLYHYNAFGNSLFPYVHDSEVGFKDIIINYDSTPSNYITAPACGESLWETFLLDNLECFLPKWDHNNYLTRHLILSDANTEILPDEIKDYIHINNVILAPKIEVVFKNLIRIQCVYFNSWEGLVRWTDYYLSNITDFKEMKLIRLGNISGQSELLYKYDCGLRI